MSDIPNWGPSEEEFERIRARNLEAYEKELTFSLVDPISKFKVEQDQRSKNRFREHKGDGHLLVDGGVTSRQQPNHTLHTCVCGWVGWLIPKEDLDVPSV